MLISTRSQAGNRFSRDRALSPTYLNSITRITRHFGELTRYDLQLAHRLVATIISSTSRKFHYHAFIPIGRRFAIRADASSALHTRCSASRSTRSETRFRITFGPRPTQAYRRNIDTSSHRQSLLLNISRSRLDGKRIDRVARQRVGVSSRTSSFRTDLYNWDHPRRASLGSGIQRCQEKCSGGSSPGQAEKGGWKRSTA